MDTQNHHNLVFYISPEDIHALSVQKARRRRNAHKTKQISPTVISLFTCGMSMDIGFSKAGFVTAYANDITGFACDTIRENRRDIHCDEGDISEIASGQILERAGVAAGKVDLVIGGPPCQSFSTAGMRRGLNDKRGKVLLEYVRVIDDIRPKFFVFENVPGLISASKKHISFYDRMSKESVSHDVRYGSLFESILAEFERLDGYKFAWRVLNAADYGVPQKRKRLVLIGSRIADPDEVFEKIERVARFTDPARPTNGRRPWRTLRDALEGLDDSEPECVKFPKWGRYLKHVPPGGCWINLPKRIRDRAMGGAADSDDPKKKGKQGGRRGFYRRLSWDAPAPTLVTSPAQLGSCICHPDEDRPLSVKEYARLQGFPDSWKFIGSTPQKYRMIGEAVPVDLARAIAAVIKKYL